MATRPSPHSPHPALCLLEDSALPQQLELKESHVHGLGVWAREVVPAAYKFGPYLGRLRSIPISTNYAWQVTDPTGQAAGWIDASEPSVGNWMKYVRLASSANQHNLKATLNKGQVYYQVTQDIEIGEELLLLDKNILYSEDSEGSALTEAEIYKQEGGDFLSRAAGALGFSSVDFDFSQHSELSDNFAFSQDSSSPEPGARGSSSLFGSFSSDADANGNAFKCVACDQSFYDVIRLDEHMLIDHNGQENSSGEYKCDQCPKVFSWKSNLIRHQAAHEEGRRYVCENCHKVFTDPSNLQRHIRSQHIGARSHACPECGKTFATSSGLKQHTHIHSSVKPFQCEVCLKSYTQFSNLCRHKRMHADCRMQIKCHKCGQAFSTVTSLSKHKRFCEGAASPGALAAAAANASASTASLLSFGDKTPPMSLAQSATASSNHLMFYPRPGFPFYPPSLVAYPMFSGAAALPPHPSLLASNPLMMQAGVKVKPDSPDSSEHAAAAMVNGALTRAETSIKKEKRGSEGSESEVSDDVSSAGISDDVDVSTGSDFDSESDDPRYKAEKSMHHSKAKTPHPEYGMSPTAREGSPKQAATYPSAAVRDHITNGMLKALTVACPPPDMPFDLSVNSKAQHMSPAAKPPTAPDATKDDEPLDLRLDHKKSPKVEENAHKTHVFGEKKEEASTPPLPPQPPQNPPQLLQQQQQQQHRQTPRTPTTPVSMSEATLSPTKFQMAYPRPIHPLMVDPQLYKPKYPPFPNDRVMVPFPHPRYPLMGPLMSGMNGSASAFEMLRSQMEKMGKPYTDVLAPHVNKLKERYSCKFCGKIFPRSANLTRHLRTHTGEQPYKCKYCERSFSISSNLQRHVRNIHNKEKPFKCPLCDRCFGQQTNLDRHLKKHESDGPTILDDSPKSSDLNEKDDAYFDEIRNFIGKVTEPSGGVDPSTAPSTPSRLVGDPLLSDKSLSNGKRSINLSTKDIDEDMEEEEEEDDMDNHSTRSPKRLRKGSPAVSEEGAPSPQAPSLSPGPASPPSSRPTKGSLAYEVMMQFNKKAEGVADKGSDSDEGKARTSPYCKDLSKSMIGRDKAVEV